MKQSVRKKPTTTLRTLSTVDSPLKSNAETGDPKRFVFASAFGQHARKHRLIVQPTMHLPIEAATNLTDPMKSSINWKLKNAAFDFKSKRGNFYLDLASVMEASPGESVTKILSKYSERYKKQSIGILCRHWLDRFQEVGTFSESLRGTIPPEDLATLSASEAAGDLRVGLEKLGHNIIALDSCKGEIWKAMVGALMLVIVLHVFIGIQAFMVMPKLEAAMIGKVDFAYMGASAGFLFGGAEFVRNWWWLYATFVVATIAFVVWALKNYTGRFRKWLDNNVLPFQMARDFNAAGFFSTIGSITAGRSNHVVQLHDALMQMRHNAYPWLHWQTKLILDNLAAHPNSKGEIFDTGIANRKTYYRILDIADYSEVPVMLQKVSGIILTTAPKEIKSRATVLRVALMAVCLLTMLGIYGGTFALIEAFKAAAQMKALSN
jgi:type II secretory pathway component PulF